MQRRRRSRKRITSGHFDFCNGRRLEPVVALAFAVDIHLDELDRLADAVAKAVWVADAVRDVGVVVELLDVVGGVPCDARRVAVVGQRCGVDPVLGRRACWQRGGGHCGERTTTSIADIIYLRGSGESFSERSAHRYCPRISRGLPSNPPSSCSTATATSFSPLLNVLSDENSPQAHSAAAVRCGGGVCTASLHRESVTRMLAAPPLPLFHGSVSVLAFGLGLTGSHLHIVWRHGGIDRPEPGTGCESGLLLVQSCTQLTERQNQTHLQGFQGKRH